MENVVIPRDDRHQIISIGHISEVTTLAQPFHPLLHPRHDSISKYCHKSHWRNILENQPCIHVHCNCTCSYVLLAEAADAVIVAGASVDAEVAATDMAPLSAVR